MSIWLFFYTRYLNFSEITTLVVMQQVVQLVFEIPTGAIADLLGKRKTLIISYALYFCSIFLTPFFSTFWVFFALEFMKGVAKSLASGTYEALTFDTLKEKGKEEQYPKVNANIISISWVAYIVAGLLGGVLYDISYFLPYLILACFFLAATIILLLKVKEPSIDSEQGNLNYKKYFSQMTLGFKELFSKQTTGTLVLFLLLGTLGYYTASEFMGISQGKSYGLSATNVSFLFTGGYLVSAGMAQLFTKLLKKGNVVLIAVTSSLFMLASYALALFVSPVLGLGLIMARIGSSSTFSNARSVILNQQISSKNRATALSTFSLLYTLPYVVVVYLGGKVIDLSSVNTFALLLGVLLIVGIAVSLTFFFVAKFRLKPGELQT